MENGKQPITPIFNSEGMPSYFHDEPNFGLTKREYFAGLAMQGLLANPTGYNIVSWKEKVSVDSVAMADALLKAVDE